MKVNNWSLEDVLNGEGPVTKGNIAVIIEKYTDSAKEVLLEKETYENMATYWLRVKQEPCSKGPYPHVSFFEAVNRISTDLVLLKGCECIFEKHEDIHDLKCCWGNKGGIDIQSLDKNVKIISAEATCSSKAYIQRKFANYRGKKITYFFYQDLGKDIQESLESKWEVDNQYPQPVNVDFKDFF